MHDLCDLIKLLSEAGSAIAPIAVIVVLYMVGKHLAADRKDRAEERQLMMATMDTISARGDDRAEHFANVVNEMVRQCQTGSRRG